MLDGAICHMDLPRISVQYFRWVQSESPGTRGDLWWSLGGSLGFVHVNTPKKSIGSSNLNFSKHEHHGTPLSLVVLALSRRLADFACGIEGLPHRIHRWHLEDAHLWWFDGCDATDAMEGLENVVGRGGFFDGFGRIWPWMTMTDYLIADDSYSLTYYLTVFFVLFLLGI